MHKIIVKFIVFLIVTLMLHACTREPEVVDASTLRDSPQKFEGKRIKFYLDAVQGALEKSAEHSDTKNYLISLDPRINSAFPISMVMKSDLSSKWAAANLDEYVQYTVTLTGTVHAVTAGKLSFYDFIADDFVINSYNDNSYGTYSGVKTPNGLPSEALEIPQPMRVVDVDKIALFPDQFKSKPLLIEMIVSKDDFKPGVGDNIQLKTAKLTFIFSKSLALSIYDSVNNASFIEIVGTLDAGIATDGTPLIAVKNVRFKR